jgi:MoxR-like ATPase
MKPKSVQRFLEGRFRRTPQYAFELVGSPGVGKTAVAHQIARNLDMPLYIFYGVNKEVVDAAGLPYLDELKVTRWGLPSFLADLPQEKPFVLLIDELNQCDPPMQKVLSRVLYERTFGDHPLPPEARIICTGNRASDRAGGPQ